MIAYTITSKNKVWILDEANGYEIPKWCYNTDGYFVVDELPDDVKQLLEQQELNSNKTSKINEIKQAFKNSLEQGYTCSSGITMDADISDIDKLQKGYDLTNKNGLTEMNIRDHFNNTHENISIDDVSTMLLELGNNYATLLNKKWQLIDQINSATTQAELDAIAW